jgi:hypothetical protein
MVDFFDESLSSLSTWMSHFQVSQDLEEVWKEEEPEAFTSYFGEIH